MSKLIDICDRCGEEHLLNYLVVSDILRLQVCRRCALEAVDIPANGTGGDMQVFVFGEEGAICLNY